jgi:hypothetical protein
VKRLWQVRPVIFFCAAAALVAAGCGKGGVRGVKVKGEVLQNGKPIKFLPSEEITVGFSREVEPGEPPFGAPAKVKPEDGTFTVDGPAGKGIPPGKYRIQLTSDIYGSDRGDRFEAWFDPRAKRPPLVAEVGAEGEQIFVVDVGQWTVKKQ